MKTKSELAQLRKQMMKTTSKHSSFKSSKQTSFVSEKAKPPLQQSLITGVKRKVTGKEMKNLTQKNYANLPEIRKKKDEEKRLIEHAERKAASALILKGLDARRRAMFKKKN